MGFDLKCLLAAVFIIVSMPLICHLFLRFWGLSWP